jgi:hypothetical protein
MCLLIRRTEKDTVSLCDICLDLIKEKDKSEFRTGLGCMVKPC